MATAKPTTPKLTAAERAALRKFDDVPYAWDYDPHPFEGIVIRREETWRALERRGLVELADTGRADDGRFFRMWQLTAMGRAAR